MPSHEQSRNPQGVVVAHLASGDECRSEHERVTLRDFTQRLAALRGDADAGTYDPSMHYPGHVYFVPSSTLTRDDAVALGIRGPDDLFGGVVPHAFVATKAISHPLVAPIAAAPAGWNPAFTAHVGQDVLAGFVAFHPDDARAAGLQLLADGPVRIKPVRATGGRGQSVARDAAELQALLGAADAGELLAHGLVLEAHMEEVRTFSVGQVTVGDLQASYFGFQRLTRNNQGEEVFGGSDLTVARGGFEALQALTPPAEIQRAIEQARRYDAAVHACYAGFYASRKNYDIVLGRDAAGRWRSGVLEQSWRVGGATGPEIAALEVFRARPGCMRVHTAGFEIFGDSPEPPAYASVHFRGIDPEVGRLTKYTVVLPDADPR